MASESGKVYLQITTTQQKWLYDDDDDDDDDEDDDDDDDYETRENVREKNRIFGVYSFHSFFVSMNNITELVRKL